MGKKSGSTQQYAPILAKASQDQIDAQKLLTDYSNYAAPQAKTVTQYGVDELANNKFTNANWDNLNKEANSQIDSGNSKIASLANGVLPESYQNSMKTILNDMSESTLGQGVNSLSNRGVINSSALNAYTNNASKNQQLTSAKMYNDNLTTASNLAQKEIDNASAKTNLATKTASASLLLPTSYMTLGQSLLEPTEKLWTELLHQQTALSSPAQTVYQQGSGGVLNGLLSGVASFYK